MIEVSQRVTVADKQLFGNHSVMIDGQVIEITGSQAKVQLDGEEFPRVFNIEHLQSSEAVYGGQLTSHHDHQIIDGIRRK